MLLGGQKLAKDPLLEVSLRIRLRVSVVANKDELWNIQF